MTTAAHRLSDLVELATASRRGVGQIHRLLALREDDGFANQRLAMLLARDPDIDLVIRRIKAESGGDPTTLNIRDVIALYGFRDIHLVSVAGAFSAIIGGNLRAGRAHETWNWVLALSALSVVTSEATGRYANLAPAAPITANLGRVLMEVHAPDVLSDAFAVAGERGVALLDAQRDLAGLTELELGEQVAAAWQLPPELTALAGATDPSSALAAQVARATDCAAWLGYRDPLAAAAPARRPVDAELDRALAKRGGPPWVPFAVDQLWMVTRAA